MSCVNPMGVPVLLSEWWLRRVALPGREWSRPAWLLLEGARHVTLGGAERTGRRPSS
eukprot:CAMPEP_0175227706 /NCGR_PEP_ID=MMETSP0093-20121207/23542_1 /TAXON_ID=311494 /ORGANISM="Alexandrium monilatum, Strain CCMP3105" /LENGTH=56 /DNA_ID=CAMNT_0016521461 /DNA_START=19 /DNA_END=185 /DNA_ORIENTATION=-